VAVCYKLKTKFVPVWSTGMKPYITGLMCPFFKVLKCYKNFYAQFFLNIPTFHYSNLPALLLHNAGGPEDKDQNDDGQANR